jgi:cytochrome d ubiquinol oxidase subunit II
MVLGAAILGRIPLDTNGSFVEIFIKPWLNLFTVSTGIFMILLFGWIASVYLIGETEEKTFPVFRKTSLVLFIALIISGGLVFLAAETNGLHLFRRFSVSPVSIISVMLATLLIPVMWRNISRKNVFWTRMLAGVITACILVGWFAVQFPVLVNRAEGQNLTIWNSRAPDVTMYYLLAALIVGIFIIFPAFAYLFKVFKFSKESE